MFSIKHTTDERTRLVTAQAAAIWLGVTQVLLAGVIFYRLYVLGQPDEEIRDFQAVLVVSLFGFMALQLFLGGVLPALGWKALLVAYLVLTAAITGGSLAIHGWPDPADWTNTWLPALVGPAVLVLVYALIARLGRWRVDREIRLLGE